MDDIVKNGDGIVSDAHAIHENRVRNAGRGPIADPRLLHAWLQRWLVAAH